MRRDGVAGPRPSNQNRDLNEDMRPPPKRDAIFGLPLLNAITVSGFKSAREPVRVRLGNLTVLAGANSAGKSTIMQPLLMLKQTIEKDYDTAGLAIDGPLVRFTSVEQFLSRPAVGTNSRGFSVTYSHMDVDTTFHYGRIRDGEFGLSHMSIRTAESTATWWPGKTISEAEAILAGFAGPRRARTNTSQPTPPLIPHEGRNYRVGRSGPRLYALRLSRNSTGAERLDETALNPLMSFSAGELAIHEARLLIYLPGLRGNPERSYPAGAGVGPFRGNFNDYVASVIHRWQATHDPRLYALQDNLKAVGLSWRVVSTRLDDTRVELLVGRLPHAVRGGRQDTVNIVDVGLGVSQTLPVLLALLMAGPGQIVFIEQPELHLHPRAQAALAGPLVEAAKRGVRVVAETHSSVLILAIQTLVAKGEIAPEHVSLNWFTRDKSGQTHVSEATLGADGSYGDWPSDFDAVELGLHDDYMTEVEKRRG